MWRDKIAQDQDIQKRLLGSITIIRSNVVKVGDIVHFNVDYLEHMPLRTGILLRMNGGMASVRIIGSSTVITVRASILEIHGEL
jgi:hypothetical protein